MTNPRESKRKNKTQLKVQKKKLHGVYEKDNKSHKRQNR